MAKCIRLCIVLISVGVIFCNEANYSPMIEDAGSYLQASDGNYIHNLTAEVLYNVYEEMLQYHVSWKVDTPATVNVTVNTEDSIECGQIDPEFVNGTEVIIPQYNYYGTTLAHGCTYKIVVMHNLTQWSSLIHKIPVCVDGNCDCDIIKKDKNVTIEHERDDVFLIGWNISDDNEASVIKKVVFGVSKPNYNCTQEFSGKDIVEPEHEFITNFSAQVHSNTTFPVCFFINFTYIYDCFDLILRDAIVKEEPPKDVTQWGDVSFTICLAVLLLMIIAFWYIDKCRGAVKMILISKILKRPRRTSLTNIYGNVRSREICIKANLLYVEQEIVEGRTDSYELPRNRLELLYEIGKGAFGEVFLGKAIIGSKETRVAVKTLRVNSSNEEMEDFLAEIDIMKKIGKHSNIVMMLKSCTLQEPYMMIMEYLPFGDLKHYLVNLRQKWTMKRNRFENNPNESAPYITPSAQDSPNSPHMETLNNIGMRQANLLTTPTLPEKFTFNLEQVLDHRELQNFAFQIANGMAHLEKIPITHRDLAARNILIDENKVLKISDFGLSRPGPYIIKSRNKLPLRWMALEAIEDHLYDNKSDVWSFGIVLWEIGTLGAFPYGEVPDKMLIYHLQMGKRLLRPEICTDELYSLMLRCWSADSNLRPTFLELVQQLDVTRNRIYIDFTQLNPLYVFPPTKAKHKKEVKLDKTRVSTYLECP